MAISRKPKHVGETQDISHSELVQRAFLYLSTLGCNVVFKERSGTGASEHPDAIGYKHGFSYLIECKATRQDFRADSSKWFRRDPVAGMGYKRYFMVPVGLISADELPKGWGLLEVGEKLQKYRRVTVTKESGRFCERNLVGEISYLASAIRRLNISMAVFVER